MTEVKLPSGAVLKIDIAPFADAKALKQAVLKELKSIQVTTKTDMEVFFKDMFCIGFSSPEIEKCLGECFKRCLYNDLRISDQTFEPENARQDYMTVCFEVAKANILPFMKSLYAEYLRIIATIADIQA